MRHTWFACAVLATGLAITAIWAWILLDRSPGWFPWLRVAIVIAGAAAAGMILARRALRPTAGWRRTVLAAAPVPLALIGGLGAPMAYSMDTAATTQSGAVPSAGPTVAGSFGIPGARSGFPGGADRRLPAGAGGGSGASRASDFAASPDGGPPAGFAAAGGSGGGSGDASQITSWVEAHFKSETVGGTTVYDLSSPKAGGAGSAGTGSAGRGTAPPGAGPGTGTMPAKPPAEGGFPPPQ